MEKMIEMNDNDMAEVSGSCWLTSTSCGFSYNSQCNPTPAPSCPTDPKGGSGTSDGSDPKGDPKTNPPCPAPAPAPVVCKPVSLVSLFGFGKCW